MTLDIDLDLDRGAFRLRIRQVIPASGLTAIVGPSGAGKSTLLRAIAGFERGNGHVFFGGEVWQDDRQFKPPHLRRVGFVFQEPRLFSHLDVGGNLAYAARRSGQSGRVARVVGDFGLSHLTGRAVAGLSGGEAQRVALARAVLAAPRLLLMDEPLSALDLARRAEILPHIERLRDEERLPILYVSHSLGEVARLATRTVALADGRVLAHGPTVEVLADGATAMAFDGGEPGSLILARVAAVEPDGLSRLDFAGGTLLVPVVPGAPGSEVRLVVRSRDVIIARERPRGISALNILPARVVALRETDPGAADVVLSCGGTPVTARVTRRSVGELGLAPGSDCYAILKSVALARE